MRHAVTKLVLSLTSSAAILAAPATTFAEDAGEPVKVACAGEHSTNSVHVDDADEYPPRLQALLAPGYEVMNFGFPRATVKTENITFVGAVPFLQTVEYANSVAFGPDIVIVGPFGRHDSAANYADVASIDRQKFTAGLEAIVRAYQALDSKPVIYLALPIPFPSGTGEGVISAVVLPATNDVARTFHLPVIDHWSAFLGKRDLFSDPDHFTPDGIQRMAEVVRDALRSAGAGSTPARSSGCAVGCAAVPPWGLAVAVVAAAWYGIRKRKKG
jgi:hypothetical protein